MNMIKTFLIVILVMLFSTKYYILTDQLYL